MSKLNNPILTPIKAIRANCIDCCSGQIGEVRLCPCKTCRCWPYRMGRRPNQADIQAITAELEKQHVATGKAVK